MITRHILIITGMMIMLLMADPAKGQTTTADSIRYCLVNGSIRPPHSPENPAACGPDPFIAGIVLQSGSGTIYCPVRAKVKTTFQIEDTWAVMLDTEDGFYIVLSNIQRLYLKENEVIEKRTKIGEAMLNEEVNKYELDLLLTRKNRGKTDKKDLLEYFEQLN